MFINPQTAPGFKRTIFNALVAPRPVGWISTLGPSGRANLAPFSQFNLVSTAPPVLMFACNTPEDRPEKDTITNVRATKEFVVNFVSWQLLEAMHKTSAPLPYGIDEFEHAQIAKAHCQFVAAPRVAQSPANLECRVIEILDVEPQYPGETRSTVVLGRVVGVHMQDEFLDHEGRFDTVKAQPVARLGGLMYAGIGQVVELPSLFKRATG
jgi:flavin reductase (DIM6/NTAB) family NADH-FMN oxidoreductase RutF